MNNATAATSFATRRPSPLEAAFFGTWTLFVESIKRYLFSRRALVLSLLWLGPAALLALIKLAVDLSRENDFHRGAEFAILLTLVPTGLLSFTCLLATVGLIQDETEEQTLTYLLLRPIPRWGIYFAKWLAASLIAIGIVFLFYQAAFFSLYLGSNEFPLVLWRRALPAGIAILLTGLAYCGVFGLLGLLLKRSLAIGIAYIILFEGVLAAIPFNFRTYTVAYHFRMLVHHWLGVGEEDWGLSPIANQTSAVTSTMALVGATIVFTTIACIIASRREFRMKTPAGN